MDLAGGDHAGNATSTCSPSGTTLILTASGTKFNTDCLAAPVGQPFNINFDNKDQVAHNIQILESHTASEACSTPAWYRPDSRPSMCLP